MIRLQEDAIANTMNAQKSMWAMLAGIFFIFTRIIIPLVKIIIKRKWYRQIATVLVFAPIVWLGVVIPTGVYVLLYELIGNFSLIIAIPLYIICVLLALYYAVRIAQRMWKHFRANDSQHGSPTNPHAPPEIIEYYDSKY